MDSMLLAAIILIVIALIFDFTNGFHDAVNSKAVFIASGEIVKFCNIIVI